MPEAEMHFESSCDLDQGILWSIIFGPSFLSNIQTYQTSIYKAIAVQLNSPRRGVYSNNFHFPADETSLASVHLFTPCKSHNHNSKC